MKQIFDWMREQIKELEPERECYFDDEEDHYLSAVVTHKKVLSIVDQAEQKWKEDVCYRKQERIEKLPVVTEADIRAKAYEKMADGIREILTCNAIYNMDCINTLVHQLIEDDEIAEQMKMPEHIEKFNNDSRKIYADMYIDDKAWNPGSNNET